MGKILAYPDIKFSYDFITEIHCQHCGGKAKLSRMLQDVDVRDERIGQPPRTSEVRLFECEICCAHTILEVHRGD